jgi:anti-anti-sigma regulatory factor
MAKNFRMLSDENKNLSVRIHLQGDFDGTSAHELVNMLDTYSGNCPRVAIDTEGLTRIFHKKEAKPL